MKEILKNSIISVYFAHKNIIIREKSTINHYYSSPVFLPCIFHIGKARGRWQEEIQPHMKRP